MTTHVPLIFKISDWLILTRSDWLRALSNQKLHLTYSVVVLVAIVHGFLFIWNSHIKTFIRIINYLVNKIIEFINKKQDWSFRLVYKCLKWHIESILRCGLVFYLWTPYKNFNLKSSKINCFKIKNFDIKQMCVRRGRLESSPDV